MRDFGYLCEFIIFWVRDVRIQLWRLSQERHVLSDRLGKARGRTDAKLLHDRGDVG